MNPLVSRETTPLNAPPQRNALAPGQQLAPGTALPAQRQVAYSQVKEALLKQSAIDRGLRGLLKGDGPISRKAVIDMSIGLVADRVMSPQDMAGYLAELPTDPQKIVEWVQKHAANVEKNLDQMMQMVAASQTPPPAQPMPPPNAPGMQPGEVMSNQSIPNSEVPQQ